MAKSCKVAIREALVHLGGEGTTEEVRDYIKSKYGSRWSDNTITTLMADLTFPGNPSSTIPLNERFLARIVLGRYRFRTEEEKMIKSSLRKKIQPRFKSTLTERVSKAPERIWDFDDIGKFRLVHHFNIPAIYTWGGNDRDRREDIRRYANVDFPHSSLNYEWYGFRIIVKRTLLGRDSDLDNVPKLIIDAFSGWQIDRDRSDYPQVELYKDDTVKWVRAIQVQSDFTHEQDRTEVWIFGKTT